jgi:hypothetical protein
VIAVGAVDNNRAHLLSSRGMNELEFWPKLVLAVLATWRLTHLVALEDGPADVFVRLRAGLGRSFLGKLMDCFHCLSLWVAAPLAWWVGRGLWKWLVCWLALSGAACLLEKIGQQPVMIEPLAEQPKGETEHGMLRTGPGVAANGAGTDSQSGSTEDAPIAPTK